MDRCRIGWPSGSWILIALVSVMPAIVQRASGLAMSEIYHLRFCDGDRLNVSCPDNWQIHISSSYFVYVSGVDGRGVRDCRQQFNGTSQCLRKIQFYDPTYFGQLIQSCQSKQRCDDGLLAKTGDPTICWQNPPSPSDYMTFSYACVNVHIEQATTPLVNASSPKPRGSTKPSGLTKPQGLTYRSTTNWYLSTSWARPAGSRISGTPGGPGPTTSPVPSQRSSYTSTVRWPGRTTTYPRPDSDSVTPPADLVRRESRSPMATKEKTSSQSEKLMAIVIPLSVIVVIAAIVAISAVIACRSPKKSSLKRKLSENSSVYFSNAEKRHSLGGDSIQTRASIHGITNFGYDVTDISSSPDVVYVDKVILKQQFALDANKSQDQPESASVDVGYVTSKEPVAEQLYSELGSDYI